MNARWSLAANSVAAGREKRKDERDVPGATKAYFWIPWPPDDIFVLRELADLKKVRLAKGQWLGVYQGMSDGFSQGKSNQEQLCASRSPAVLYRRLQHIKVMFPVIARRAPTKDALPERIEPRMPDKLAQMQRCAIEAVAVHRQLVDPDGVGLPAIPLKGYVDLVGYLSYERMVTKREAKSLFAALRSLCDVLVKIEQQTRNEKFTPADYSTLSVQFINVLISAKKQRGLHVSNAKAQNKIDNLLARSEKAVVAKFDAMSQAAEFLRDIRNRARNKGSVSGDRSTEKETRRALEIFRRLASGETLKGIAVDEAGSDYLRKSRSLCVTTTRFAKRLANKIRNRFGANIRVISYKHILEIVDEWPGIDPIRDLAALKEAARRGLPQVRVV